MLKQNAYFWGMKIKKLGISNFKSLVDFELVDLKSFCAFVGPNASGKSNIFEALEFTNYLIRYTNEAPNFFGGMQEIISFVDQPGRSKLSGDTISFTYSFDDKIEIGIHGNQYEDRYAFNGAHYEFDLDQSSLVNEVQEPYVTYGRQQGEFEKYLPFFEINDPQKRKSFISQWKKKGYQYANDFEQFADNYSRIFVGKSALNRIPATNTKLSADASNLSQIIGIIFENQIKRNDFIEWLRILIPEFKNIEVKKSNIDGSYDFFIYEKGSKRPFSRNLISDGTYNILSLMAAVYQSNQPQFLCIEEPENGLHPQAIEFLVDFFREKSEGEGHHIWLNTHSQTLVRCLEIDEIILINKVDGATKAKQLTKDDEVNIKTDEAWLSNALGGGVLWSK